MRNISVVVISKNQKDSLATMLGILKESLPNSERTFVLDRCTDNSKEFLIEQNEKFIERTDAVGFCAGSARNLGLDNVNPYHDVLFFDGDRIPSNLNETIINQALNTYDIVLIKCKEDMRTWFKPKISENPNFGTYANDLWTCGFVIKRTAIDAIKKENNDMLFNTIFDGHWGCEDLYLGDVAYHAGLSCGGFPQDVYLKGNTTKAETSQAMIDQNKKRDVLRAKLRVKPVPVHKHTPTFRKSLVL